MTPIAPETGHSLVEHGEVFLRIGVISFMASAVGSIFTLIRDYRKYNIGFGRKMVVYYLSKLGTAFVSAYLALLVFPMFGLGTSTEAEQAVALLAAIASGDFVGLLLRRVLGDRRNDYSASWHGIEKRRERQEGEGDV